MNLRTSSLPVTFFLALAALSGCSSDDNKPIEIRLPDKNPFPSTYQIPNSTAVHFKNAHVLTGAGEFHSNAEVIIADGKFVSIGSDLETPAGAQVMADTGPY